MIYLFLLIAATVLLFFYLYRTGLFRVYARRRGYEEGFLDFLTIILTFESNGVRLDETLMLAGEDKIVLPKPYDELAKRFKALIDVVPDPYTCIRRISDTIPSRRVKGFFRGYSEVLVTTNDTLSYVNSALEREIEGRIAHINNLLSLIESLYEGLLIMILGVIVYSITPINPINPLLLALIFSIIGVSGYLLTNVLVRSGYWRSDLWSDLAGLLLLFTAPIILFTHHEVDFIIPVILGVLTVYGYLEYRRIVDFENYIDTLVEELYSDARQGLPIDTSMVKLSRGGPGEIGLFGRLLSYGYSYRDLKGLINTSPFVEKIIGLTFTPLEYSSRHERHLGYVLKIMDSIKMFRRRLYERSRLYYIYALTIPVVVYAMYYGFRNLTVLQGVPAHIVSGLGLLSVLISLTISSKIGRGCSFCDLKNVLTIIAAYILFKIIIGG